MNSLKYPLEQLAQIKNKRLEQALKILEEKRALFEKEKKILEEKEKERDTVLSHKKEKLTQLRNALDEGTTTDKIQTMKIYLKVVDEQLQGKEKQVSTQKEIVKKAEQELEQAKSEFFHRKKDVEKLEIHKKQWETEVLYWESQQESSEQDELGATKHLMKKKQHLLKQEEP